LTRVWVGGRIVEERRARVSAADRGFLFGDGLFETVRTEGARPFRLPAHLERLRRGAARISLEVPAELEKAVARLLERAERAPGALRITLTRGVGAEALDPASARAPTLVLSLRSVPRFPEAWYERGLALLTSTVRVCLGSGVAGLKSIGYLPNILALAEARARGADDGLLLDDRGRVAQACSSNVFWVADGGELRTASPACGILEGVTRAAVLELARAGGIPAEEGEWDRGEIARAREAFTTSSLRGVVPVASLDGRPVGGGWPGEVTRGLARAYRELLAAETA
jgi:branched-chain amino acid aminotransferase